MSRTLAFFDALFGRIFSEVNQKLIERVTLWLSLVGFVLHLVLIYSKKFHLFHFELESQLLDDPISAIYTPFSIILVYEIYLLIVYLPRSFTTAVSKQFEIISLILIRRIFGDIPKIDLNVNWLDEAANRQLIYDLFGGPVDLFFNIPFQLLSEKTAQGSRQREVKTFCEFKKGHQFNPTPRIDYNFNLFRCQLAWRTFWRASQ